MPRFMGTETEYGISTPTDPMLSPIITSTHAVVAFAGKDRRAQWDFGPESPLKDSRGFDLRRYHTVPTIAPDALGVANVMTANGSRFYVDHAHPEYSAPETTNAFDAMLYDAAGDVVLNQAVAGAPQLQPGSGRHRWRGLAAAVGPGGQGAHGAHERVVRVRLRRLRVPGVLVVDIG